jgi:beta-phosphoglucomutase-like phosphatase (HAD superfamily)
VVAIEDSATGMAAARAGGLVCVGIRTAVTGGQDFQDAVLLVNSLTELDPLTLARLVPDGTG